MKKTIAGTLLSIIILTGSANAHIYAKIITNFGTIDVHLFDKRTPITVSNFIKYAKEGRYNNTLFHRVVPGFMIQGGGYNIRLQKVATYKPIQNESRKDIYNKTGFISMARSTDPNSATNQFFINTADNYFLDKTIIKPGYAVFGEVIKGLPVVRKIESIKTSAYKTMKNVPTQPIIIKEIIIRGESN